MLEVSKSSSFTMHQITGYIPSPVVGDRLAVAIPAYNEVRFIGSVVLQALRYTSNVIVIDDGSTDGTAQVAERAGALVLRHEVNRGKAQAINTALAWARCTNLDALVFIDGDGQHRPDEIECVVAPVLEGDADLVVGSRFLSVKSDIPAYRKIGQHTLTAITNIASSTPITDSQSGFRALSRKAIEVLHFSSTGLSVESEMQFRAKEHDLVVTEVPISVVYVEKAKRNPLSHGMQIVTNILQLVGQHRPFFFFGMQGALLLIAGAFMSVTTVDIYARTHLLAVGYALLSVMLLVVGSLSAFVGLILHSMRGLMLDLRQSLQQ